MKKPKNIHFKFKKKPSTLEILLSRKSRNIKPLLYQPAQFSMDGKTFKAKVEEFVFSFFSFYENDVVNSQVVLGCCGVGNTMKTVKPHK